MARRSVQFGIPGDVIVPGDYNGDGSTDRAVYRPSTGIWFVQGQGSVQFGIPGDIPVPGDYNGDGRTDRAVYRRSTGTWFVQDELPVQFGLTGDIPVPGDYNADLMTDIAVYRPSTGTWFVQGQGSVQFGLPGDIPVPGDYDGDCATDLAVYRPSTGTWFVQGLPSVQWGIPATSPCLATTTATGRRIAPCIGPRPARGSCTARPRCSGESAAICRCLDRRWWVTSMGTARRMSGGIWRTSTATARPTSRCIGHRPGSGTRRTKRGCSGGSSATCRCRAITSATEGRSARCIGRRPATWFVQNQAPVQWGLAGDIPGAWRLQRQRDDGRSRCITRRPGTWWVAEPGPGAVGIPGDVPVPGDYNGNGTTDIAVYRPSTGHVVRAGPGPGGVGAARRHRGAGRLQRRRSDRSSRCIGRRPAHWCVQGQADRCRGDSRRPRGAGRLQRRRDDGSRGYRPSNGRVVRAGTRAPRCSGGSATSRRLGLRAAVTCRSKRTQAG